MPTLTVVDAPSPQLSLHDANGRVVVTLISEGAESRLTFIAPGDQTYSELGVMRGEKGTEVAPRVLFVDAGQTRVRLERRPSGGYGLIFHGANGAALGGLGEDPQHSGIAYVADGFGKQRVQLRGATRDANVKVFTPAGIVIAALSRVRQGGGGFLQLTSAAGVPLVDAGPNERDDGIVRTGPGSIGVSGLGTPGSYIVGMKGSQ